MLPRKPSPSAHVMCGLGPACSVLWGKEHNPFGGILLVGGGGWWGLLPRRWGGSVN